MARRRGYRGGRVAAPGRSPCAVRCRGSPVCSTMAAVRMSRGGGVRGRTRLPVADRRSPCTHVEPRARAVPVSAVCSRSARHAPGGAGSSGARRRERPQVFRDHSASERRGLSLVRTSVSRPKQRVQCTNSAFGGDGRRRRQDLRVGRVSDGGGSAAATQESLAAASRPFARHSGCTYSAAATLLYAAARCCADCTSFCAVSSISSSADAEARAVSVPNCAATKIESIGSIRLLRPRSGSSGCRQHGQDVLRSGWSPTSAPVLRAPGGGRRGVLRGRRCRPGRAASTSESSSNAIITNDWCRSSSSKRRRSSVEAHGSRRAAVSRPAGAGGRARRSAAGGAAAGLRQSAPSLRQHALPGVPLQATPALVPGVHAGVQTKVAPARPQRAGHVSAPHLPLQLCQSRQGFVSSSRLVRRIRVQPAAQLPSPPGAETFSETRAAPAPAAGTRGPRAARPRHAHRRRPGQHRHRDVRGHQVRGGK